MAQRGIIISSTSKERKHKEFKNYVYNGQGTLYKTSGEDEGTDTILKNVHTIIIIIIEAYPIYLGSVLWVLLGVSTGSSLTHIWPVWGSSNLMQVKLTQSMTAAEWEEEEREREKEGTDKPSPKEENRFHNPCRAGSEWGTPPQLVTTRPFFYFIFLNNGEGEEASGARTYRCSCFSPSTASLTSMGSTPAGKETGLIEWTWFPWFGHFAHSRME